MAIELSARDTYLETQVATATPQRLRLMLVDGALRHARAAEAAWQAGRAPEGMEAVSRCREIVGELIAGIHPDQTPLAKQVLAMYLFIFSSLTECQLTRDPHQIAGVIRVLEEEQQTWQEVCRQLPDRPAADAAQMPAEELAPQVVASGFQTAYDQAAIVIAPKAAGFSIDA